ncbi:TniQ family protein [Pseudooceanicola algae]|nr:TniQ family protein [Pseudooceanicola algae]
MRLRPYVTLDTQETAMSFAGRLAAIHTGQPLHWMLADMRINGEAFTLGRPEAISRFAAIAGIDEADLLRVTMRGIRKGMEFRGEQFHSGSLSRAADKYCPACLAEDGEHRNWRQRLIWCVAAAHRCPRHGIWLQRSEKPARTLQEATGIIPASVSHTVSDPVPCYLQWLEARLQNVPERDSWLDEQGLEQVLDASLLLGVVMREGHKIAPNRLSVLRHEAALEEGFRVYSQGPEALVAALDRIREASPAQAAQAGPLAKYGKLYEWMNRQWQTRDPGPLLGILRDHIIEHDVLEAGTKVLGEELKYRRFHSVQSLGEALGHKTSSMARMLKKIGHIPHDASMDDCGLIRFDAREIAQLVQDFKTGIPLADLDEYIGASFSQARALYRDGVLKPVVPAGSPGAIRHVVFSRRSLDAFLAQLAALPDSESAGQIDLHPVGAICQRKIGTTSDVVRALLANELPAFRCPDGDGLASVLLPLKEVTAIRAG